MTNYLRIVYWYSGRNPVIQLLGGLENGVGLMGLCLLYTDGWKTSARRSSIIYCLCYNINL